MLSRSLGSKSSAAASAAPSSGRKSIPVLLAALQQCSSIDKQNATVAIKRLAAAVDAEPDMRCNYPCSSSSSPLLPAKPPQRKRRLLPRPRPHSEAPRAAHQEVRAHAAAAQCAAGRRPAQGATSRGAVSPRLLTNPLLFFCKPTRVEGGKRASVF